ncbi:hypothetical protein Q1W71_02380 [Flavobacterium pectinovorum]|uniref:hypothetical protein n=1 Tax=Flavobacterium pectinovorum TaxID=29533 RepID=UPI00265E4432|nr:hypothetical protein [Flavobacterium pectinovorum]WKL48635.1 hypothetical protein Q1W71_02380 [Flavobacterium pectinovorum]
MKHLNLKLIFFIIAISFLNIYCSSYCDDEDLRRDQNKKEAAVIKHQDSLNMDID